MDRARTGNDAITWYSLLIESEIGGAVFDECVDFFEAITIEQYSQTFASSEFPFAVLVFDPLRATAKFGLVAKAVKVFEFGVFTHMDRTICWTTEIVRPLRGRNASACGSAINVGCLRRPLPSIVGGALI